MSTTTEHVLAITIDGTTDWQTSARSKVNVVEVNLDLLAERDNLFLDEIKDLARKVKALPDTIPGRDATVEELHALYQRRKQEAGAFC